jgi:cytosine/uracil/thiamine/allantoin permease
MIGIGYLRRLLTFQPFILLGTWTRWAYISFWAINQICISNWQQSAALVAAGLSVWQAVIATIIGKLIIAAVAIANGYVGVRKRDRTSVRFRLLT